MEILEIFYIAFKYNYHRWTIHLKRAYLLCLFNYNLKKTKMNLKHKNFQYTLSIYHVLALLQANPHNTREHKDQKGKQLSQDPGLEQHPWDMNLVCIVCSWNDRTM